MMISINRFCLLLCAVTATQGDIQLMTAEVSSVFNLYYNLFISIAATTKPIIFKYVDQYVWRWDDSGSGAHCDVSIWKPVEYQAGYYPLGDVAVATHSRPSSVSLTVSAQDDDALAAPSSFTQIWKDSGSGQMMMSGF